MYYLTVVLLLSLWVERICVCITILVTVVCDCWCREGNDNARDKPENFVIVVKDCFSILVYFYCNFSSLYVHVLLV